MEVSRGADKYLTLPISFELVLELHIVFILLQTFISIFRLTQYCSHFFTTCFGPY
jgi:hypothetical protein